MNATLLADLLKPISTPLVIIAHSLGGLVVKQVHIYGMGNSREALLMTHL